MTTYKARTSEWVNVADNGVFPATCGVRIAMVFDVSASVDSDELTKLKNAGKAFLAQGTGLGGTGTQVGLFPLRRERGAGRFVAPAPCLHGQTSTRQARRSTASTRTTSVSTPTGTTPCAPLRGRP